MYLAADETEEEKFFAFSLPNDTGIEHTHCISKYH